MIDWILRFVKGVFIGSGFILPGVSGGALAAVFGVYERIISFLAHVTHDFKNNFVFFIPLCLGGMTGVFLFSFVVSFFLGAYETQILWFFIGCILGTLPALWEQAGKGGRQGKHIIILAAAFWGGLAFMIYGETLFDGGIPQNFSTWILAGALIGFGGIIPGLSSSNLLLYMGMYKDMADGIKDLNFSIIIPVGIGAVSTVLALSKLMDYVLRKAYTELFHGILGIVLASSLMIVPRNFNYLSFGVVDCIMSCLAGAALGYWMCSLERKYKHASHEET